MSVSWYSNALGLPSSVTKITGRARTSLQQCIESGAICLRFQESIAYR